MAHIFTDVNGVWVERMRTDARFERWGPYLDPTVAVRAVNYVATVMLDPITGDQLDQLDPRSSDPDPLVRSLTVIDRTALKLNVVTILGGAI